MPSARWLAARCWRPFWVLLAAIQGAADQASRPFRARGSRPAIVDKICLYVDICCIYADIFVTLQYKVKGFDMVIQLSFQFEGYAADTQVAAPQSSLQSRFDCCRGCEYQGLCDFDECAQKCYPLDMPFAPTIFPNLGVYIDFLKHHGWR